MGKRKPAFLDLARALPYVVAQGGRRTIALVLSPDAKALLRRGARHKVRLTLKPSRGASASKNLTLRRG